MGDAVLGLREDGLPAPFRPSRAICYNYVCSRAGVTQLAECLLPKRSVIPSACSSPAPSHRYTEGHFVSRAGCAASRARSNVNTFNTHQALASRRLRPHILRHRRSQRGRSGTD